MSTSPRKVLIAEDNPGLARVLSFKFKASGFLPVTCADGQLAWEAFQGDDFVAVLSDQEMPRMTGIELCRNVRSSKPNLPFFLISSIDLKTGSASGEPRRLNSPSAFRRQGQPVISA